MNERITTKDVEGALGRYVRALSMNGIDLSVRLDHGSKVNGRAFRIFKAGDGYSAPGTNNGYLGMTKHEAWDTLLTLARMAEDIAYNRTLIAEGLDIEG